MPFNWLRFLIYVQTSTCILSIKQNMQKIKCIARILARSWETEIL